MSSVSLLPTFIPVFYTVEAPRAAAPFSLLLDLHDPLLLFQTHIFNVEMTCEGCSGAVERVLNRLKGQGVDSISISLPEQKVSVISTMSADQLLDVIKKTGKKTTYVGTQ